MTSKEILEALQRIHREVGALIQEMEKENIDAHKHFAEFVAMLQSGVDLSEDLAAVGPAYAWARRLVKFQHPQAMQVLKSFGYSRAGVPPASLPDTKHKSPITCSLCTTPDDCLARGCQRQGE